MTLKFDHAVIYGGNYYPANSPIEVAEEKPVDQAAPDIAESERAEKESPDTNEVAEEKPVDQAAPKTEKKAAKDGNKRAGRKPKS